MIEINEQTTTKDFNTTLVKVHQTMFAGNAVPYQDFNTTLVKVHPAFQRYLNSK